MTVIFNCSNLWLVTTKQVMGKNQTILDVSVPLVYLKKRGTLISCPPNRVQYSRYPEQRSLLCTYQWAINRDALSLCAQERYWHAPLRYLRFGFWCVHFVPAEGICCLTPRGCAASSMSRIERQCKGPLSLQESCHNFKVRLIPFAGNLQSVRLCLCLRISKLSLYRSFSYPECRTIA
jgi:hypothetical protein